MFDTGLAAVLTAFIATLVKQPEILPLFFLFFCIIFGLVLLQVPCRSLLVCGHAIPVTHALALLCLYSFTGVPSFGRC